MSKLQEMQNLGYEITLLPDGEIDVTLPVNQELTPNLKTRLQQIKPTLVQELQDQQKSIYRYTGYSTRSDKRGSGRLVLDFLDTDTGELIPAFFNVNIAYQRGPKKGQNFKVGRNGRFWVLPGCKFARMWNKTIGQPDKCSTLYRQMGYLKPIRFTGEVRVSETYEQITNLKKARL